MIDKYKYITDKYTHKIDKDMYKTDKYKLIQFRVQKFEPVSS